MSDVDEVAQVLQEKGRSSSSLEIAEALGWTCTGYTADHQLPDTRRTTRALKQLKEQGKVKYLRHSAKWQEVVPSG